MPCEGVATRVSILTGTVRLCPSHVAVEWSVFPSADEKPRDTMDLTHETADRKSPEAGTFEA